MVSRDGREAHLDTRKHAPMTTRKLMRQVGLSGNSDVMNGTGSYPGLFGFDFSDIVSKGKNFTNHIKFAYEQGAVIANSRTPSRLVAICPALLCAFPATVSWGLLVEL